MWTYSTYLNDGRRFCVSGIGKQHDRYVLVCVFVCGGVHFRGGDTDQHDERKTLTMKGGKTKDVI